MPTIRDGNITLDITLIRPPTPESDRSPPSGQDFLQWWKGECKTRGLPPPRFAGADHAIARRLVDKHGLPRLETLARHYFRRHNEGPKNTHEMVIFSAKIPLIETELKEQAS